MAESTLIIKIKDRVNAIVFDCNTFTYAKATNPEAFRRGDYRIGGGNFLIALGVFSELGFIAKVYVILASKIVKNRDGSINETEAVWSLIQDMPDSITLGLPKDKQFVVDHWKQIRHALVHMNYPKLTIFSWGGEKGLSYEEITEKIRTTTKKPFFKLGVRIEILANHLYKIIDWIEIELDKGKYLPNSISEAEGWIDESLFITEQEAKNREKFWQYLED